MKKLVYAFLIAATALLTWQCAQQKGTVIEGTLSNAQTDMQVFLDYLMIGKASNILGNTTMDANGHFSLDFPEGLQAGVYNLRIGAKRISLVLDGSEKKVTIEGDLNTLQTFDVKISGSASSQSLANVMSGVAQQRFGAQDISKFVDTTSNPTLGAFVAASTLGGSAQFLDIQKKALQRLDQQSEFAIEYGKYLQTLETQLLAQQAQELIKVGQPAPDIRMKDPKGKEYALSELKGKVVLLDFWASWCGPCRRENPNVVKVYEKYKSQGFTVFSVSLDGLDSRSMASIGNQTQIDAMMSQSKQKWVDAIQQDGLSWEFHVSDLKKWDSAPAAIYGVRGIPKAFLIDRNGNIAAVGVRGAEQIEAELQRLL